MSQLFDKEKTVMSNLNAVVVDLETTGLAPKTDKIIEIGAVRIRNGKAEDTFSRLVYPGRVLSTQTSEITGITDDMLKRQPVFAQILDELLAFLGEDVLLGHNIQFDFSFLKKAVLNELPKKSKFEKMGIDTLRIARRFLPGEQKKTLSALCDYYDIPLSAHRAANDALATFALYEKLYEEFADGDPEAFRERQLIYQVKKESPVMEKQIRQIRELLQRTQVSCPYDIEKMTKNEASRYIDSLRTGLAK